MTTDAGNGGAAGTVDAGAGDAGGGEGAGATDTTKDTGAGGGDTGGDSGADDSGPSLLDGDDDDGAGDSTADLKIVEGQKPEGLDDKYWDAEKKTVKLNDLHKALGDAEKRAKGLRDKLAAGNTKAPKDIKEYGYKLENKELAALIPDGDPVMADAKAAALKAGLPKEAFATFMQEFLPKLYDHHKGAQPVPYEQMTPEQKAAHDNEAKEWRASELKKIGPNGAQVTRTVEAWVRELGTSGALTQDQVKAIKGAATNAHVVSALNELRGMLGGEPLAGSFTDDGLPSDAEIADMIDKNSKTKDPATAAKIDELLDKRRIAGRPPTLQF